MPAAQKNPRTVNARRFAALLAGFDIGNSSEEEALSKGRALRRMAAESNMRIVDLLEMPEIRQAIDDQMQPARQDHRELQAAHEQAAAMREELTERTRDVRKLAEMLTREKEAKHSLLKELKASKGAAVRADVHGPVTHSFGAQSWVFETVVVGMGLVMLIMSVIL